LEKKDKTKRSLKDFNIRILYAQYNKELDEINLILDDPQTIYDIIEIDEMMNDNKAGFKLQKHQKDFVKNWSLSSQEVTICYYGVGSGKTIIMILCAEQYLSINQDSFVYFCVPSSLVLNVIREMINRGIDPRRKNKNGEYMYNFLSYSQILHSTFDFKNNTLLIVDEAHNLRNVRSKTIHEKISARKRIKTDTYTIKGNVLASKLINTDTKFSRCIFFTGTLFVNTHEDIEALISIGYKKNAHIRSQK
jgi:superfamily II DNA or RNA helicase